MATCRPLRAVALLALSLAASGTVRAEEPAAAPAPFLVDGKPFVFKGVTYPGAHPAEEDFQKLNDLGANSIRTWGVGDGTPLLLDLAQKHGIKVMVGVWMRHGRPGAEADDSFDWLHDEAGKKKEYDKAIATIARYKDHPAVLAWGLGNEVTLNIATEPEKVAYAQFLQTLCEAVKKMDPAHPIASVSAWSTDWKYWRDYVPAIDWYGANVYGYGVYALPGEMTKLGIRKPFFLGEFGVTGEWEAKVDGNGIKTEPDDKLRYAMYADIWPAASQKAGPDFLGGFLFNLGNELSYAGEWLDFFSGKDYRPSYWGARKAFTGKDPENYPPAIESFIVREPDAPHAPGSWLDARVDATDKENGELKVSFYYNRRTGTRQERDAVVPLRSEPGKKPGFYRVELPTGAGAIKLYAFVEDSYPNVTVATTSLRVE